MRRRELVALVGGLAAWPLAARAQPAGRVRRIGVLTGFPQNNPVGQSLLAAFREQLKSLGWIEGGNIHIEIRWGNAADPDQMRAHAIELTRMMPDVIVVHGSRSLVAVRQETKQVPIIFATVADPVAFGYVESLARPGGNVTGFTNYTGPPSPKLLETLKEAAPGIARVAFVITPDNVATAKLLQAMESVAPSLGVTTTAMLIRDPAAIPQTIADFAQQPNGGLVVTSDVFMLAHRDLIIAAAARHRLPAAYQDRTFVEAGGLLSYSTDRRESYRRVAQYVDLVFKGAHPRDLPVQQPARFQFVLNLKTAKALGLNVTRMLLARADEVID